VSPALLHGGETPRLVALTSPVPESGKSTVALHLIRDHDFQLVKFADPLKNMIRTLLADAGVRQGDSERYINGDWKEKVIPQLAVTGRHLQMTLGTEWGRRQIRQNIWVGLARVAVLKLLRRGYSVVMDDMRFENELEMVSEIGGTALRIVRPGVVDTSGHVSEGGLRHRKMIELTNDDTIEELWAAVDAALWR